MKKTYVVRTDRAGVFFGEIKSKTDTSVEMINVRKIHYWQGASAVEQISQDGVGDGSRLTITVPSMEIDKWIQIIPCSEKASTNLTNFKAWKQ